MEDMLYYYKRCFQKYATFDGRARRKEFWYFTLMNMLMQIGLTVVDSVLGTITLTGIGVLGVLYNLAILIPSAAVSWRRMHDIGRSGWWSLITLLPLFGILIWLFWATRDSEAGNNEWGANPKLDGPHW